MRSIRIILGVSLVCLLFSLPAMAQTTTSTIEGTVTDAHGAVVAGCRGQGERDSRSRPSARPRPMQNGFYRITALPAGTYTVTVSQSGFATSTSNIELTLNRIVTFDVQLQVGNCREM